MFTVHSNITLMAINKDLGKYDNLKDALRGAEIMSFKRINSHTNIYVYKQGVRIATFKNGSVVDDNICLRTARPCINGAYDGKDGYSIDCCSAYPGNCAYRI